jgi:hypothetical protein
LHRSLTAQPEAEVVETEPSGSRIMNYLKLKSPKKMSNVVRTLEECPRGYPRLAAFLDSDENFMIYRRFGFLHARVLLQKQDELRELEEDLDQLDKKDAKMNYDRFLACRQADEDRSDQEVNQRKEVLGDIAKALAEYDQILLHSQQLAMINKPTERDYTSVANFLHYRTPLVDVDAEFIYKKEDLITLRPGRESAWLDAFVERVLKMFPLRPVQYLFCSEASPAKALPHPLCERRPDRTDVWAGSQEQDHGSGHSLPHQVAHRPAGEWCHHVDDPGTSSHASLRSVLHQHQVFKPRVELK